MGKKMENKIKQNGILRVLLVAAVCLFFSGIAALTPQTVYAADGDTAGEVKIADIDYDNLTMSINADGNSIVYYSKDKKKWYELEGYDSTVDKINVRAMDISWVSATADTKLYFKGNQNTKIITVTLPKRNTALKVKFDKVTGDIEISNSEAAVAFEWRKKTDYDWKSVPIDGQGDPAYDAFLKEIEGLRVKGAKIIIRTPSVNGTSADDTGARDSKEVTLSVTKRANAPSVTVNIKKFTLNTTVAQEYSIDGGNDWKECDKTMQLSSILPGGIAAGGEIWIRKAATSTAGYSKTRVIPIEAQRAAPGSLAYYFEGKKLVIQFADASTTNQYEYFVQKPGKDFDPTTAAWKTVKTNKVIKMTRTTAPEGSIVYFRYKGTTANRSKGIDAVLPSAYKSQVIQYPAQ